LCLLKRHNFFEIFIETDNSCCALRFCIGWSENQQQLQITVHKARNANEFVALVRNTIRVVCSGTINDTSFK